MTLDHPLLPPEYDAPLLKEFLRARGVTRGKARDVLPDDVALLTRVAATFARLPFENLTEIIKDANAGCAKEARRAPREVLTDHWTLGTGGTCFALTATLLYLVRALGWQAEPILADRRYGADTHSALVVWLEGRPHLLDPGYLIVQPLLLPTVGEVRVQTTFNQLILIATDGGAKTDLYTSHPHPQREEMHTYRLTYKTNPVDAAEFLRAWDVSFDADMMRYPVLSRVVGQKQVYFQKQHLLLRSAQETRRVEVPPDRLIAEIAGQFKLSPSIVAKALSVLQRKGVKHGRA